ncbi:hypothetical protein FACS189454_08650 [Planctomycetales bacterium]|nr:hypothetical protein FACS189454_08650 [Planctomycetales bacterium]
MPNSFDILTSNQADGGFDLPIAYPSLFPELSYFEASASPNMTFKLPVITPDASQAKFREPNAEWARKAPNIALRTITAKTIDASWIADDMTFTASDWSEEEIAEMLGGDFHFAPIP